MIEFKDTALVREVVASAQINGGTRVIVLTAERTTDRDGFYVESVAYDSNHPGELVRHFRNYGTCLTELLTEARAHESRAFEHAEHNDGCDCWARWDPNCGRPGCWGTRVTAVA